MANSVANQTVGAVELVPEGDLDIQREQQAAAAGAAIDPSLEQQQQPAAEKPYETPIEDDLEGKPFDFSAFAKESKTAAAIVDKTEKPPAEVAAKPAVETEVAAAPTTAVQPAVVANPADPRGLLEVEEEYRPALKQMSLEACNKIKPVLVEQKKLREALAAKDTELAAAKQGGLPANYYEHEMGYVLSPEFTRQSSQAQLAESVLKHWRGQLDAVRGGADTVTPLVQNKEGQIVVGEPQKVDRGTLTELEGIRDWAQQQHLTEQANLRALSAVHKEKHGQVKEWIGNFQARSFGVFDKDPVLGAEAADTMKTFPVALHNNPLAPMLARAFVALARMAKVSAPGTNGKPAAPAPVNPAAKRQPSAAQIAGGSASNGGAAEEDLMAQFNKAKKGIL